MKLTDNVTLDAEEEEENKMFPRVRKIDRAELEALAEDLKAAKPKRMRKTS